MAFPSIPTDGMEHLEGPLRFHYVAANKMWLRGPAPTASMKAGERGGQIGQIVPWFGSTKPSCWLWCNGAKFDRRSYPALYDFLKTDILPLVENWMEGKTGNGIGVVTGATTGPPTNAIWAEMKGTVSKNSGHSHIAAPHKGITGWRLTTSTEPYDTDDWEGNADHGKQYTSYNGEHLHQINGRAIARQGPKDHQPLSLTAKAIIRAMNP